MVIHRNVGVLTKEKLNSTKNEICSVESQADSTGSRRRTDEKEDEELQEPSKIRAAAIKEEIQADGDSKKLNLEELKEEELRKKLYEQNIKAKSNWKNDNALKKEKNLQKLQKLTNRMKKFSEADKDTILNDLSKLNVFMFLSELSSSIVEANLRVKDIMAVLEVCSALHQTYPNFHKLISSSILRAFQHSISDNQIDNVTSSSSMVTATSSTNMFSSCASSSSFSFISSSSNSQQKRRMLLRLYCELLLCGICEDAEPLISMLNDILSSGNTASIDDNAQQHLSTIEMFCKKFAFKFMDLKSALKDRQKICTKSNKNDGEAAEELPKETEKHTEPDKTIIPKNVQEALIKMITTYYEKEARKILLQTYLQLTNQELICEQIMVNKGSVDSENQMKCNAYKEKFNKVKLHIETLGEMLNFPKFCMQEIQEEAAQILGVSKKHFMMTRVGGDTGVNNDESKANSENFLDDSSRWESEKEREFYSEILDLKELIAPALFGASKAEPVKENTIEEDDSSSMLDHAGDKVEMSPCISLSQSCSVATAEIIPLSSSSGFSPLKEEFSEELSLVKKFTIGISQLVDAPDVDKFAVDFFLERYNNRNNRKKLAKAMLIYQKSYHIPAVARLVATFHPYFKDISQVVVEGLQNEFKRFVSEKNPIQLEIKVRCMLYIGELVKFGVMPPGVAFECFNVCLEDLTNHHAEMACELVQSCGRYLLYGRSVGIRFQNLLDKMLRICRAKNLPLKIEMQIEDAYFKLKTATHEKKKKEKPLLKSFIHYLLFVELENTDEDRICKTLRKLPWNDQAVLRWMKKAFLDMDMNINYELIGNLAALLSALAKYKPDFVIECVDGLMEEIQISMERNDFRDAPRRVRHMRFLGELYNYRLVNSTIIFDTLYHFIGFSSLSCYKAGNITTAHKLMADAAKKCNVTSLSKIGGEEKDKLEEIRRKDGGGSAAGEVCKPAEENKSCLLSSLPSLFLKDQPLLPSFSFTHPSAPEDPPGDFFRIKLICVLLETCGKYFCKGVLKMKLQRFYVFFQRYLFTKGSLPLGIDYMVKDVFEQLIHFHQFDSLQETDDYIRGMLREEAEIVAELEADVYNDEDLEEDAVFGRVALADDDPESANGSENEGEFNNENSLENLDNFHRETLNPKEEDMFEKEIQMAFTESIQIAKMQNANKRVEENRSLPHSLLTIAADSETDSVSDDEDEIIENGTIRKKQSGKQYITKTMNESADEDFVAANENEAGGGEKKKQSTKKIKVLLRKSKKNKIKTKTLKVPTDCKFTQSFIKRELDIKEERQEVKKFVMQCMEKIDYLDIKEKQNYLQNMFYMNSHKYSTSDENNYDECPPSNSSFCKFGNTGGNGTVAWKEVDRGYKGSSKYGKRK